MSNWFEMYVTGRQKTAAWSRIAEARRAGPARNEPSSATATIVLVRGNVASFRLKGRKSRIRCMAGRLWVTSSGKQEDVLLSPGESVSFSGRSKVVIEALRTATVRLEFSRSARLQLPAFQAVASPRVSAASQPRIAFFL
jgi:hypothetical protein